VQRCTVHRAKEGWNSQATTNTTDRLIE
jgi:hypothetical protein